MNVCSCVRKKLTLLDENFHRPVSCDENTIQHVHYELDRKMRRSHVSCFAHEIPVRIDVKSIQGPNPLANLSSFVFKRII